MICTESVAVFATFNVHVNEITTSGIEDHKRAARAEA